MAYVRGARRSSLVRTIVIPEEPKPLPVTPKPKPSREPAKCGTTSGYQRHYRSGEPPCDLCRAANAVASQKRRDRVKATQPPKLFVCGTLAGHRRHYRRGETPCLPCRAANAAHKRAWLANRKVAA